MPQRSLLSCLVLALTVWPIAAQEEATVFDITVPAPGARSLGFGGAFVALADEAATAFSNPAGLHQFLEPEFTLEIRGIREALSPGQREPGFGVLSSTELQSSAFLAFVYPWKKISLAVYQNGFGNIISGSRLQITDPTGGFESTSSASFGLETTGLAGSYRWSETFSIGLGVSRAKGNLSYERTVIQTAFDPGEQDLIRTMSSDATDAEDWGFNLGFLWRFSKQWQLGGVFRDGPEFMLRSERASGRLGDDLPVRVRNFPVELPNTFGVGLLFRTKDERLSIGFEWDWVRYSSLLGSFPGRGNFELDDGHELHVGLEYVIARWRPAVALRVGGWLEPDHALRYLGNDPIDRATFSGGDTEPHYSVGLGFAWKSLKLDAAYDSSELVSTVSISMVYAF